MLNPRTVCACALLCALVLSRGSLAQSDDRSMPMTEEEARQYSRDFESRLNFQTGQVTIGGGLATINLPAGARFLGPEQARWVVESEWGNPPDAEVIGLVVPPGEQLPFGWAIVVAFQEMGYVEDDDARDIDAGELLQQMQDDVNASNPKLIRQGYPRAALLGWAESPSYDEMDHKLYWATKWRFGDDPDVTLNYDIRILGRRGVLSMLAVAYVEELPQVRPAAASIAMATSFNAGHRYEDFDSSIDEIAAYTVGGLVAGKILAKAGILKVLLKPLIFVGVIVAGIIGKIVWGGRQETA